ncbi:hypothetical protein EDD18DRAFT_1357722 [Armillaria luteobubalina]|uniref:Transmembrane protein n=1 Tax=Armillaria luteobubalina TaxID=153913 RepID=A0AA39PXM1_9AGAR|nr:hypothetical protein EDD18DRAFT_1357722 [Armillaria luteobubalina]
MVTVYLPTANRIRLCFFFSLVFSVLIPVIFIVLGVELHLGEFEYNTDPNGDFENQTVSISIILAHSDVKKGSMVLQWTITDDSCFPCVDDEDEDDDDVDVDDNDGCSVNGCPNVNIYFDSNLLHSESGHAERKDNNKPADPTFVWNVTADDDVSKIPSFQIELGILPPLYSNYSQRHLIRSTRSSEVYYPFDRYEAITAGFAEDTSNATVSVNVTSASGLAVGLKISADPEYDDPDSILLMITLQRGTLVIWYCLVITITFWIVTLTICLLMIMTVGFGFQQRNEIVVVPVSTVFAFTQLRSTMPGAPDGFGDILDFVGVLPCLVLLSICAVTMVRIYLFTDPAMNSHEKLTWSGLESQFFADPRYLTPVCNNFEPPDSMSVFSEEGGEYGEMVRGSSKSISLFAEPLRIKAAFGKIAGESDEPLEDNEGTAVSGVIVSCDEEWEVRSTGIEGANCKNL